MTICADAVRNHHINFASVALPEEIKDVLKQSNYTKNPVNLLSVCYPSENFEELKWEKLAEVAATTLTTASMNIHAGKLWLIGGGGAYIYSYHLGL